MIAGNSNWIGLLRATSKSRWIASACCVLILSAAVDSQILQLLACATSTLSSQGASQSQDDGDDDEMIVSPDSTAAFRTLRRKAQHEPPVLPSGTAYQEPGFTVPSLNLVPAAAAGEQDRRNGIGAPLLC